MPVLAKAKARNLLASYGFTDPSEIEPEEIANAEYLIVNYEPLEKYCGRITYTGSTGIITVDSNMIPAQQRFVTAHELGHFLCDKHDRICTIEDNRSFMYSQMKNEKRANTFAAELLMPAEWFKEFTGAKEFKPEMIKRSADYFNVSLTAAAIRYTEVGEIPTAVIMSTDKVVKWKFINPSFPYKVITSGKKVSRLSNAFDHYDGREIPEIDTVRADAWFEEDLFTNEFGELKEANITMPNYNSVLTILWEAN